MTFLISPEAILTNSLLVCKNRTIYSFLSFNMLNKYMYRFKTRFFSIQYFEYFSYSAYQLLNHSIGSLDVAYIFLFKSCIFHIHFFLTLFTIYHSHLVYLYCTIIYCTIPWEGNCFECSLHWSKPFVILLKIQLAQYLSLRPIVCALLPPRMILSHV